MIEKVLGAKYNPKLPRKINSLSMLLFLSSHYSSLKRIVGDKQLDDGFRNYNWPFERTPKSEIDEGTMIQSPPSFCSNRIRLRCLRVRGVDESRQSLVLVTVQ